MGQRQLSVSSDSRLLDDEIKQEVKVILRPKRPPRPQSEVFLDQVDKRQRSKRYSAFGVSSCLLLRENNVGDVDFGLSLLSTYLHKKTSTASVRGLSGSSRQKATKQEILGFRGKFLPVAKGK